MPLRVESGIEFRSCDALTVNWAVNDSSVQLFGSNFRIADNSLSMDCALLIATYLDFAALCGAASGLNLFGCG